MSQVIFHKDRFPNRIILHFSVFLVQLNARKQVIVGKNSRPMPFSSYFPAIQIPEVDILTYLFPPNQPVSEKPIWIDSKDSRKTLSPRQALHWIKRLSCGLERAGVKRGEVVMTFTPNHIFVPVAYLGIIGGGYIFSGANSSYTKDELVHQIQNTNARVILVHPSLVDTASAAAEAVGDPKPQLYLFSDEENAAWNKVEDWRSVISSDDETQRYVLPGLQGEECKTTIATLNYSSGTTGLPKGVCVTHYNLIANLEQNIFLVYLDKSYDERQRPLERWLGLLPLYHAYGQLFTILMACKLQIPVYVMKAFVYEDFLRAIQTHKINRLQVAPPVLVMLAKRPETAKYDISSVKDITCGAAPLSRELQNEIQTRFGLRIRQGWGMTEITTGGIALPGGFEDDSGSVGVLGPGMDGKLVDEAMNEVRDGEPGELYVRGPQISLGYWRNENATRELLVGDGWLRTGDIAVRNSRGLFWIVDRKKELIKVNGLQVAPAELEVILLQNEHVADAAVVGVVINSEEYPRAYVVLQERSRRLVGAIAPTPHTIQAWIAKRTAKHKHLTGGVVFVNEVPKLASGKIHRKILREWSNSDAVLLAKKGFKSRL